MSSAPDRYPEGTRRVRERRRDAVVAALRAALAERPQPGVREVRLFGSWARGDFDSRSDIDLLVITDDEGVAFDVRGLPDAERIDVVSVPHDRLVRYCAEGHAFHGRAMADSLRLFPG